MLKRLLALGTALELFVEHLFERCACLLRAGSVCRVHTCKKRRSPPRADPRAPYVRSAGVVDSCAVDRASLRAFISAARAAQPDNGAHLTLWAPVTKPADAAL